MATGQIDLEAEYNNRARVPEHPEIISGWMADASAYRAARSDAALDQPYGDKPRQVFDMFPAQLGTPEQPRAALFIHGGYWQALDKTAFSHMARGLNAHGFDVAVANYSLCPDVEIGDIITEMQALTAHLWRTYGKSLLVYGHSAGGHLAAALMATDCAAHDLPEALVDRAMPISGLFDLTPLIPTSINTALKLTDESALAVSPLTWPVPAAGRFSAVVGGDESSEYLRQSRDLTSRWHGPGLEGELDIQAGANHFTVINPLADPGSALTRSLARLGG
ncbi:alpha/beta hydrolase [uncultured Roseibium sp.]|uniref:alpha/beta hydrolase n=1 Tax=uncultured Roseibium sp. TaxID=1936171 RepID=UPI0025974142|nr:alpha/beta hydrolase [uncultured Roseibium sp.]